MGNDGQFRKLCDLLGAAHLADEPRFRTNSDRSVNRDALRTELAALLAKHEAAALAEILIRYGVPCGPVLNIEEALAHPHVAHRGMVLREGDYVAIAAPVKLSRTPASLRRLPPKIGEHDAEILSAPVASATPSS